MNRVATERVRIALVDDHPTLLKGIEALLRDEPNYEIAGIGASAAELDALAASNPPDVAIVDLSMPGDVVEAVRRVAAKGISVVIFTAYDDVDRATRALEAGARAFVLKGRPVEELLTAIETVRRGETFVTPDFARKLAAVQRNRVEGQKRLDEARLSLREKQLVDLLLEGKSNKEIARSLNLTEKTVKHYMTNLMSKLGVRTRVEVILAVRPVQDSTPAISPESD